jgi:hypothetical protein
MTRIPRTTLVPPLEVASNADPDQYGDDLTEEEIEQAAIGDLFAIQGAEFQNVSWSIFRFRTRAEIASDPQSQAEEWVADRTGELHGTDVADSIGGGTFRFRGYLPRSDGRGVRIAYNRIIAIAGARRNFSAVAVASASVAPAAVAAAEPSRVERAILRMLRDTKDRLDRLERTPVPIQPAGPSLKDMAETLTMLDTLRQRGAPATDTSIAKELFGAMSTAMKTGIELGQGRDPLPAGEETPGWIKAAEIFGPIASRVLDQMAQRRGPVPPATARPQAAPAAGQVAPAPEEPGPTATTPASGSSAEVIEDEDPTTAITAVRMMAVIDLLARGIGEQADIEETADVIYRILPSVDLEAILRLPDQAVVEDIAARYGVPYPELATPAGRSYIASVLAELKHEPEPDLES